MNTTKTREELEKYNNPQIKLMQEFYKIYEDVSLEYNQKINELMVNGKIPTDLEKVDIIVGICQEKCKNEVLNIIMEKEQGFMSTKERYSETNVLVHWTVKYASRYKKITEQKGQLSIDEIRKLLYSDEPIAA